jgi:predicted  nucleic acid-binding Zn-ribbon protein
MARTVQDTQNSMGDQLQQLEGEKISLMKRLNMVLSELEKATHEKSDISSKLRHQERIAEELKHKLEEISGLKNVVNRNMQDDL